MKIAWFSAGITSAVACKLAVEMYEDVEIYYIHINTQHSDNWRFIAECEQWIGRPINIIQSEKYKDQFQVIEKTGYVNGAMGARCTLELKKKVRIELEEKLNPENQIFGFEFSQNEINRAIRFKEQWGYTKPLYPLIERKLSKNECAGIINAAGIELPAMYKLGYNNNNCIGCVKGKKGYWNKIRKDFPSEFQKMVCAERIAGHSCIKRDLPGGGSVPVFLDELKPDEGLTPNPVVPDCGMFCQVEFAHLMDKRVKSIVSGEMSICEV